MIELGPDDKKPTVLPEASAQETPQGTPGLQEFIQAAAKANGVSPQEAAAAFEDNGWDVAIIKGGLLKKQKKHRGK